MKNYILTLITLLSLTASAYAQEFGLHFNINEAYSLSNSELGHYPVLWYSSNSKKVLLGGFGLGLSYEKSLQKKFDLFTQLNIQRSRFRDKPTRFLDENGQSLGNSNGINTSYTANLFVIPTLKPGESEIVTLGIGLGLRYVLSSKTNYGEQFVFGELTDLNFDRRSTSPIIFYLPVRLRFKLSKIMLETGFDYDLSNASRLRDNKDKFLTLQTGVAYRFIRSEKDD